MNHILSQTKSSECDLAASAEVFVDELLSLQSGETLLIYVDRGSDCEVTKAIETKATERGVRTEVFELNSAVSHSEQAQQLVEKIRQGSFQAICELSEAYFYLTPVWTVGCERGARIYSLAALDASSFVRCVGEVDHKLMFEFGMAIKRILDRTRSLRVTTKMGTDIQMEFGPTPTAVRRFVGRARRQIRHAARRGARAASLLRVMEYLRTPPPQDFIFEPLGLLGDDRTTLLGGLFGFRGIPASIEGTAVIDGYMWPPTEVGLLTQPIVLKFKNSSLVDVGGCPVKSKILAQRFQGQTAQVEHFCIGFNPGARLGGKLLEAERVFGGFVVGIGQEFLHTDGIIKNPTLIADGNVIEQDGSFVSKELLSLERDLIRGKQSVEQMA